MNPHVQWLFGSLAMGAFGVAMLGAMHDDGERLDRVSAGSENEVPTFYADVMPILQENCVECHQEEGLNAGGMVAPMPLTSYEEARPFAPMIAARVKDGTMPPWQVHSRHVGTFIGERYLAERERETLIAWAEGGAPAGDPADAPPSLEPPASAGGGWWIGEPDFTLFFDEPYLLEDDLEDRYVDIQVELTEEMMPEPRWVKAREARPGGPHVHHIVGGIEGMAPGYMPTMYREGHSRLFCEGPRTINFQMHYNKTPGPGTAVEDISGGAVIFYEEGDTIRHIVENEGLGIMDFVIPAGDPNYSATYEYVFEEDMYILEFNPHMHLRGKAALYEITYPDSRYEILLEIPNYDFNWQQGYRFEEPVLAPKGSVLEMTLWWDNSLENPHNPDPTVDVRWGEPTTAEMGFGFMQMTRVEPREIIVGEPIPEDIVQAACSTRGAGERQGSG